MKLTKEGLAIIEGDMYLSRDIELAGRLDVARDELLKYRQYIPEGGVVVDVGACLGDYTATFAEFVGEAGHVLAFEPNPLVMRCLKHNMMDYPNVTEYSCALGSVSCKAAIHLDMRNIGASWLAKGNDLPVRPLDNLMFHRLDFIKIDAEGWEPWVLDGAKETITRFRPVMLIEIDTRALGFQNFKPQDVHERLTALDYAFEPYDGPHGDILCLPKERAC